MSISVVINTKNAASTLKRALESVGWADQLVVMDMLSTDKTLEIAQNFGAEIYSHPDVGFVEPARNAALAKANSHWVLLLDADEEVPEQLQTVLQNLSKGDATADAYYLPRKNIVFGEWYRFAGWWPDYQLRFFKNKLVTWDNTIHSQPHVAGTTDKIAPTEEHALIHQNYQTIEQFLDRLNRYTTHEVQARPTWNGQHANKRVIRGFSDELLARLFKHEGIDGGIHGVGLSFLQAMYELVAQLKIWQAADFPSTTQLPAQEETIAELRRFQRNINYWIADWQVKHTSGLPQWWWRVRRKLAS